MPIPGRKHAIIWNRPSAGLCRTPTVPGWRIGLGLAYFQGGGDPQRVVDRLSWSVAEGAEEPFEAYGILAQAYLRLPKPDLHGALEATRKQLALPTANESALAAPRLLCGELLSQLNQAEEARQGAGAH